MSITSYLEKINKQYQSGHATEHSYRGDFAELVKCLVPDIQITNEPSKVTDCGNPDYVITRKNIPIGFIEAKDLGKDLNSKQYKEQFGRYRKALDNLIITDYIWFQFFQNGVLVSEIKIAEIDNNKIKSLPENYELFTSLISNFCEFIAQTIKSPKKLAEMMAAKARLLENILEKAITSDETNEVDTELKQQYETFKSILIHDLTPQGFADIYAQTLAYGMFAARLNDKTLEDFSRQEAAELIPKSNPFLRKLFNHVAGVDIDDRIVTTVDNLADVFRATNVKQILKNFGKSTQTQDPIIHFYETFLAEYDPKLRKARGVWYTPEPVVNFIVRGVDEILKNEFSLKDGLADTSKTTIKVQTDQRDRRTKSGHVELEKEVHKVQILDPATGTGTFLSEVVKYIYGKKFKTMQGVWSSYVEEHLIPRLNGFELLMASYSMAHLKLDLLLKETGYQSKKNQRLNIFLTNSLEEHHPDTNTLFSSWLSSEANEANNVKRDTPVMVIMGNPPYSGESANKGSWIMGLMDDYKKEPGGKEKLRERNPKWINDDYVKFLRYGQHFIEKKGEGVLAFINPHGFLDNPTFRGMRWNLLKTYDKIYTIDLHGNSKKKEVSPDGSPDVNVFDIQQGVSISFFIKTGKKKANQLGEVLHYDLYGAREFKYEFLNNNSIYDIEFEVINNISPMYYWVKKDFEKDKKYKKGFFIKEMFLNNSMGSTTGSDSKYVKMSENEFDDEFNPEYIKKYSYRPFDMRYVFYKVDNLARPRKKFMASMDNKNIAICLIRRDRGKIVTGPVCSRYITDKCIASTLDNANIFPLFMNLDSDNGIVSSKIPNLSPELVEVFSSHVSEDYKENSEEGDSLNPYTIFYYIIAVLNSSKFMKEFGEFIKLDFPYIPYPKNKKHFFILSKYGKKICELELMDYELLENFISSFPYNGSNEVTTRITKKDWELYDLEKQLVRIMINEEQCFEGIPLKVWEFYKGGYQPAQKWLKDRVGRTLCFDDILHYQKVIVALNETDRITQEIDNIDY